MHSLIDAASKRYGASEAQKDLSWKIVSCEDGALDPGIQSGFIRPDGKREESWGLAQINLPYHPEVSKEEAIEPSFAIDFLIRNVVAGKEKIWVCARKEI